MNLDEFLLETAKSILLNPKYIPTFLAVFGEEGRGKSIEKCREEFLKDVNDEPQPRQTTDNYLKEIYVLFREKYPKLSPIEGKGQRKVLTDHLLELYKEWVDKYEKSDRLSTPNNNENITPNTTSTSLDFIGRNCDIKKLAELNQKHKLVLLKAAAGIGKSTLARYFLETHFTKVIRLEMGLESGNVTPAEEKVSQILRKEFDEEPSRDFQTNLEILRDKLSNKSHPIGVLIDNLEPALDANFRFLEKLRGYEDLLRILGDRDVCSSTLITSRRSLIVQRVKVHEYSLQGLDIEAWREYFGDCENGETSEDLEQMCVVYNGNAKVMDILQGAITNRFDGNIAAYWNRYKDSLLANAELETLISVEMDWLRDNQPDAYKLLCRMGCYRYQDVKTVPFEGLICLLWDVPESRQTLVVDYLSKSSLIEVKEEYYLHTAVRESAKLRLLENKMDWRTSHHKAADFWTDSITVVKTSKDCIQAFEAFHHLISIEDWVKSALIMTQYRKNEFHDFKHGEKLGFSLQRLGLTESRGVFDLLIKKINQDEILVELNHMMGQLTLAEGYEKKAIPYFEETINIASRHSEETINITSRISWEEVKLSAFYALGICHIELWNIREATEIYATMIPRFLYLLDISKEIELNEHLARTFLGLLFSDSVIIDSSLDYQDSIDMFVNTLRHMEEIQLGLSPYEKVLNRLFGAKSYECVGNYRKAEEFCKSAYEIASNSFSQQLQARSLISLGRIYRHQRNLEDALVEIRNGLSKISQRVKSVYVSKHRYDLAIGLLELALIYRDLGELDECKKHLKQSENIFMFIESSKQVRRVKEILEFI